MQLTAVLALLVLAFGLPRLLVLCSHDDGCSSLTFAHAPGACCHDHSIAAATPRADTGSGHDAALAVPHDHCDHSQLAVELAPAPRPDGDAAPGPAPACGLVAIELPPIWPVRAQPPQPPATGPPRVDRRTALRATTLLLL
jgi:hypothetical protein